MRLLRTVLALLLCLLLPAATLPLLAQDHWPDAPPQPEDPAADEDPGIEWADWSARYLKNLRDEGKRVFVFVYAQWDLSSLANEENAFKHPDVAKMFAERQIVALRADMTQEDPAIKDYLALFGKDTVPLAVYYPPGAKAVVLNDSLTGPLSVTTVIEKADKDAGAALPQPTQPQPTDPQPTDPQPTDPTPTDPQPSDPTPTDPQPTDPVAQPADPQPTGTGETGTGGSDTSGAAEVTDSGLPQSMTSFFAGLWPGQNWLLGAGPADRASTGGKWLLIITAILILAIGIDWRRPFNLRSLDILLLIGIYPFVLWQNAAPGFAYAGVFAVTAYFFARLLLDGHRHERPPTGFAPMAALVLLLLVTLAWNGFVIMSPNKPVGGEMQRLCMGAELLDHTNKLPYGQARVMGDQAMAGPLAYFLAWPVEAAMPATATKDGEETRRIVPADASAREQMDAFSAGQISASEAVDGGYTTRYPAARILTVCAHAIIIISLVALGWQFHGLRCGLTLAILWGLNPFVLQGLNQDIMPLVLAPLMLAIAMRHNSFASGVCLAAAAGIGVWPVLLFPLFLGYYLPNDFRKALMWISIFAFTVGFFAMLQPGATGSGVDYHFIGWMMFIVGLAAGVSTILYTGSVTHKWAGFTMFYTGAMFVCLALLIAFTSPVGLLTPEAKEQGIDVQARLAEFVDGTIGRQLQTAPGAGAAVPAAADAAVAIGDWWSLRGRGFSSARIELVIALVLLCFVLSFLPDRPTSQSLITLSAVILAGSTLWMSHAGHGWSPWWIALALPALLLPMPRRDRDDVPGWENDPVRSVDTEYDELADEDFAGEAEPADSQRLPITQGAASSGSGIAPDIAPVNVPPDAQPPSVPPPSSQGLVSGGAKPGLAGLTVQAPSSPSPRRDRAPASPRIPGAEADIAPPGPAGHGDISSTQDIAHYLQNEFGAEVDEMSADALANTGMPPRVPPPPPPPPPPVGKDADSYVGGTIGLDMPAKTMEHRPDAHQELLDDEPRIITTPPQDETQWDPESQRALEAAKAGHTASDEPTVENPRQIPEPARPDDSTDIFTKSNLLTPDPDEDVEDIE